MAGIDQLVTESCEVDGAVIVRLCASVVKGSCQVIHSPTNILRNVAALT